MNEKVRDVQDVHNFKT